MRLSIVSPTPPTWGSNGAVLGDLSTNSSPRGRERSGFAHAILILNEVQRRHRHRIRGSMAATKKVVVQLGGFNWVVHVACTNETSEREALLKCVREAFCDRIAADDCVTLQIKDDEWQRMYIDFFANDVPDRAVLKVIVEAGGVS